MKKRLRQSLGNPMTVVSLVFTLIFIGAVLFAYLKYGNRLLAFISDEVRFKAWIDSFGYGRQAVFVAIRAFQTVIKIIPAEPLEIASGYMFGTFGGAALCLLGSVLGSLVILLLAKIFGERILEIFVPKEKIKEADFLKDPQKITGTLWIVYLIPSTPKDLITYFACFLPISVPKFLIITSIARIPSIITSTWCGSQLEEKNYLFSAIIFGVTAVAGIGGAFIYARIRKKHEKQSE